MINFIFFKLEAKGLSGPWRPLGRLTSSFAPLISPKNLKILRKMSKTKIQKKIRKNLGNFQEQIQKFQEQIQKKFSPPHVILKKITIRDGGSTAPQFT